MFNFIMRPGRKIKKKKYYIESFIMDSICFLCKYSRACGIIYISFYLQSPTKKNEVLIKSNEFTQIWLRLFWFGSQFDSH